MASIRSEELLKRLAAGKMIPAILLDGSDPYLRKLSREKIIETFVPEAARDWAVARFSADDDEWDAVIQRAQTVPMLAPRQVVIVECVEAVEDLGDDAREAATAALRSYLNDPAPFTIMVLEAAIKLDKRMAMSKLLDEKALTVAMEMDASAAVAFAITTAKEFGVELEREAADVLVDATNAQAARIRVELDKLSLYAQQKGTITAKDVEELVESAQKYVVWEIADVLVEGRRDDALVFLDGLLRQGEQPPMIVGALALMYRRLLAANALPPRTNKFDAARLLNSYPDLAERAMIQARRFSRAQLIAGIEALADTDSLLKSGVKNARAAMEFLIMRLAAAPRSKSSAA